MKKNLKELTKGAKKRKKKREALEKIIQYMEPRVKMMDYEKLINQDLVIASGVIEGAARYVVGERMDCSGMRWIPERAEAILKLRCIELNEEWDYFYDWVNEKHRKELKKGTLIKIRTDQPMSLPNAA